MTWCSCPNMQSDSISDRKPEHGTGPAEWRRILCEKMSFSLTLMNGRMHTIMWSYFDSCFTSCKSSASTGMDQNMLCMYSALQICLNWHTWHHPLMMSQKWHLLFIVMSLSHHLMIDAIWFPLKDNGIPFDAASNYLPVLAESGGPKFASLMLRLLDKHMLGRWTSMLCADIHLSTACHWLTHVAYQNGPAKEVVAGQLSQWGLLQTACPCWYIFLTWKSCCICSSYIHLHGNLIWFLGATISSIKWE